MKRLTMIGLALGFALASCSFAKVPVAANSAEASPGAVQCNGFQTTAKDDKAMFAAETIYNVPAQAYVTADAAGKLTPAFKATAKPLLAKLASALDATRLAYQFGDDCTFAAKVETLREIAGTIKGLPVAPTVGSK